MPSLIFLYGCDKIILAFAAPLRDGRNLVIKELNILKKIFSLIISVVLILSLCSCKSGKDFVAKKVSGSTLQIGDVIDVQGVGTLTLTKVHMAETLYAAMTTGSYVGSDTAGSAYIDAVFRFKNDGKSIACADIGYITATGVSTGKEYTHWVNAVEDSGNKNLHANVMIDSGATATLHMAVPVPSESADEKYKVKIQLRTANYDFEYTVGENRSDAQEIFSGQSLSNSNIKVKVGKFEYSMEMYEDAPSVLDAPDDMIYLTTELDVSNHSLTDKDVDDVVSVSTVYGTKVYTAEYYVEEDGRYVPEGVIPGDSHKSVLAVMHLPINYSREDTKVCISVDHKEFYFSVSGSDRIISDAEEERLLEEQKQKAQEEARKAAEELRKQEEERQRLAEEQQDSSDSKNGDDGNTDVPEEGESDGEGTATGDGAGSPEPEVPVAE